MSLSFRPNHLFRLYQLFLLCRLFRLYHPSRLCQVFHHYQYLRFFLYNLFPSLQPLPV